MSRLPFSLKIICTGGALLALFYLSSGCSSLHGSTKEISVIKGTVAGIIHVDSEHGSLNGVSSPEIIYDLYLQISEASYDSFELWITRDTLVYEQQNNELKQIPLATLKDGEKVQAHIGAVETSGYRPGAYTIKIIVFR